MPVGICGEGCLVPARGFLTGRQINGGAIIWRSVAPHPDWSDSDGPTWNVHLVGDENCPSVWNGDYCDALYEIPADFEAGTYLMNWTINWFSPANTGFEGTSGSTSVTIPAHPGTAAEAAAAEAAAAQAAAAEAAAAEAAAEAET